VNGYNTVFTLKFSLLEGTRSWFAGQAKYLLQASSFAKQPLG